MMSTRTTLFMRMFYKHSTWSCRFCATFSTNLAPTDPGSVFFKRQVQTLLRSLTRVDEEKVFQPHKDGTPLRAPMIKFMTQEDLERARRRAYRQLNLRLQMPPVVKVNDDKVKVLSEDVELKGFTTCKHVFTDISYGLQKKDRLIVVRDPNGTLRHANQNERNRINQTYYPVEGKEMTPPKMFYDPYLTDLIKREEYNFILDRACIQFDPDEPDYHRVTKQVYDAIYSNKKYDSLRSTRHFGPLVFHLTWEKKMDDLLVDVIINCRIDEALSLIKLYHIIHSDAKSADALYQDDIEIIKTYAEHDSPKRFDVEHALLHYEQIQAKKQELDDTMNPVNEEIITEEDPQNKTE